MKKPTREQQLTQAINRLAGCQDYLVYRGHGHYGGVVAKDIALVLDELESLRLALVEQRQALVEAP